MSEIKKFPALAMQLDSSFHMQCAVNTFRQNHTVESCPLTKCADNGLLHLRSSDANAVTWLRNAAMKAVMIL